MTEQSLNKLRRACITRGIIALYSPKRRGWILMQVLSRSVHGHTEGYWRFPDVIDASAKFATEVKEFRALPRKGGRRPYPRRKERIQKLFKSERAAYTLYLLDPDNIRWI